MKRKREINMNVDKFTINISLEGWKETHEKLEKLNAELKEFENRSNSLWQRTWIKAREQLPDTMKPVIITWVNRAPKMKCYEGINGKPFIGVAHYWNGKWCWYSSASEDLIGEYGEWDVFDPAIEVIAWRPLPQPYESEDENE